MNNDSYGCEAPVTIPVNPELVEAMGIRYPIESDPIQMSPETTMCIELACDGTRFLIYRLNKFKGVVVHRAMLTNRCGIGKVATAFGTFALQVRRMHMEHSPIRKK
jgi:hypothetical protein